jgi:hypothetical protein
VTQTKRPPEYPGRFIPALRVLLETVIPKHVAMDGFEVEHDFPNLGRRTMLLNARQVIY